MKIGISSWAFPWAIGVAGYPQPEKPMGAMALLERAIEASAQVLQIADNLPLHTLLPGEVKELAMAAKHDGIALEVGTRGLNPQNLLRYLDFANLIGSSIVRTLPHDGSDRPNFAEALNCLHQVRKAYETAGVTLAIENHDFYASVWLKELIEAASSPYIGVCLDTVNNLGLGESFREVIGNLGRYTVNFHCKDYIIARKPTMLGFDVVGCPSGKGMLDYALARRLLNDDISWIVELWLPWQGNLTCTLKSEEEWLYESISYLRLI